MKKCLFLILFFVSRAYAVTVETDHNTDGNLAKNYDEEVCISQTYDQCISTVCQHSEEPDCNSKCEQEAKEKCEPN